MRSQNIFESNELTPTDQAKLAKIALKLFQFWKLDTSSKLLLLGLSPTSRAILTHYHEKTKLHLSKDTIDRISWLLAIHHALRSLYPENLALCYNWVNLKNQHFNYQSPLEYMLQHGLIGIAKVAKYLELQLTS